MEEESVDNNNAVIMETEITKTTDDLDESDKVMDTENVTELCRLCDQDADKLFSVFDQTDDGLEIMRMIKENLPIIIYRTDPLSKLICEDCLNSLRALNKFKKLTKETQEKHKEKLKAKQDEENTAVQLFLDCETEHDTDEIKDVSTSTEDLTILCSNCKQAILDGSCVNGEVELCTDLHKAIAESLRKNRVRTESESEKVLRKRKIQPLYQEFEDSLCSSLTEHTRNTELDEQDESFSQCGFESNSDVESEESEERPAKRSRLEENIERVREIVVKKEPEDSTPDEEESEIPEEAEMPEEPEVPEEPELPEEPEIPEEPELPEETCNLEAVVEKFMDEPEYTYEPLSLLQLVLNVVNKQNIPEYEPEPYDVIYARCYCKYCDKEFQNIKLLSLHEPEHMDVVVEEKIDHPRRWNQNKPDAGVRNKWLEYFDENGYDEDDIVIGEHNGSGGDGGSLLVPDETKNAVKVEKDDQIVLIDMKPMVNGVYLGDYTKDERKNFYQGLRVGGQTKRFCPLCRYCFKDNWAIESHYFSLACHFTCRYCGMRFNKQRPKYEEHIKEHEEQKHEFSDKIYAASKVNNFLPKILKPDRIREPTSQELYNMFEPQPAFYNPPASPPPSTNGSAGGGYQLIPGIKIKEEPKEVVTSQSKTGNQAYFCRKCYKVFFKLDEFNIHNKKCNLNQYPTLKHIQMAVAHQSGSSNPSHSSSGSSSSHRPSPSGQRYHETKPTINGDAASNLAGRPMRNCAKEVGPYKDELYIPKELLRETLPASSGQQFVCHICGTPFPTIYSRNSHMRIHKGETLFANAMKPRPREGPPTGLLQMQLQQQLPPRQQSNYPRFEQIPRFDQVKIKQEPIDSFEPMVEIHEGEQNYPYPPHHQQQQQQHQQQVPHPPRPLQPRPPPKPLPPSILGDGAVSITPINKKPPQPAPQQHQRSSASSNLLRLVQNNPHLTIKKSDNDQRHRSLNLPPPPSHSNGTSPGNNSFGNMPANFGSPADADKSYKCSSCWEAFANKSHLYFHKKNQCEGSRYPCPFCKKRFGTEAAYSSHIFYSHPE